jgi:hypothetical protein
VTAITDNGVMTDTPEGQPVSEYHDCPARPELREADWKTCLYGIPEKAAATLRPVAAYWIITTHPPTREEPS